MPQPKRPKKAFIQFAIAALIALIFGIGAIAITLSVVSTIASQTEAEKAKLAEEAKKAKEEAERIAAQANRKPEKRVLTEVLAAVDIPAGTPLTQTVLETVEVEDGQQNVDGFPKDALVIGKVSGKKILAGQVITRDLLIDTSGMPEIEDGKRAMTIPVSALASVNGAVIPGAYVDVLITLKDQKITKTLLQNVRVIASGAPAAPTNQPKPAAQTAPAAGGSGGGVTLMVTPRQAEMLALAADQGTFILTLRGFSDKQEVKVAGMDVNQLVSGVAATAKKLPAEPKAPRVPAGIVPVNLTAETGGLPAPQGPAGGRQFTMEILKGNSPPETKQFEWDR